MRVRAHPHSFNYDNQQGDGLRTGISTFADELWKSAGRAPERIDVARIYDDYPTMVLAQANDLGLVPGNDLQRFARREIGERRFPLNTWGGMLSAGQPGGPAGGLNGISEAVLQLQHRAGERQVAGARLAVATGYGMTMYRYGGTAGCGRVGARGMSDRGVGVWRCVKCRTALFPERLLCPRCYAHEFEPDRVYKAVVEEVSAIRHMLGQTDWQPRRIASVRTSEGERITVGLRDNSGPGRVIELFEDGTAPYERRGEAGGGRRSLGRSAHTRREENGGRRTCWRMGEDAQRAVPRHHDGRRGHAGLFAPRPEGAPTLAMIEAVNALLPSCRPEQRKTSMLCGRFQSVAALAEHRALSRRLRPAPRRVTEPLRDAVDGGAARQHEQRGATSCRRDVMRLNRFSAIWSTARR